MNQIEITTLKEITDTLSPIKAHQYETFMSKLDISKKRLTLLSFYGSDKDLYKEIIDTLTMNVSSRMEVIDIAIGRIRKYIAVSKLEKKQFGEVFTPAELVIEMLSTLPKEVWKNSKLKWFDHSAGTGVFPLIVIKKLMNGLKEEFADENTRYKHIIENMIYTCELQVKNSFLYMCAVDPKAEFKLNLFSGSFLSEEFNECVKNKWNLDGFDIIIGNPPYQDVTDKIGKTAATLWPRFLAKSIEDYLNKYGYFLCITPISWMSPGKQLIRNRSMPVYFRSNRFLHLNMNAAKFFKVNSYFSYYLIQKINGYDEGISIKYDTQVVSGEKKWKFDFSEMEFIPKPDSEETLSIVRKVLSTGNKIKLSQSSLTRSDKPYVSKIKSASNKYPIKHTNTEILWSSIKPDSFGKNKVIINSTGNFNPIYDNGVLGTSQITRWVEVKDVTEGNNLIGYLNSKLLKFVLASCRWSGAASKVVFEEIPSVEKTISTDIDLYKYFNLTQEEIDHVEKIKTNGTSRIL